MDEFTLINRIQAQFSGLLAQGMEGIGDDCAVLPTTDGQALVLTTDLLTEGVHFLLDGICPRELGAKSLAVNLSDVAAMGAAPVGSLLAVALPAKEHFSGSRKKWNPEQWISDFMEGYHALSEQFGVPLLGGDTSASASGITISVTAIGRTPLSNLKRRSAARVGDSICVAGELGASATGLQQLLANRPDTDYVAAHRNPIPQVLEGQWLGGRTEVHAMMDLSDGLASDLRHILRLSAVGATIELSQVPRPAGVSLKAAVAGGEDYKLLFTCANSDALSADYQIRFGVPIYRIGTITEGPELVWLMNGEKYSRGFKGYSHRL